MRIARSSRQRLPSSRATGRLCATSIAAAVDSVNGSRMLSCYFRLFSLSFRASQPEGVEIAVGVGRVEYAVVELSAKTRPGVATTAPRIGPVDRQRRQRMAPVAGLTAETLLVHETLLMVVCPAAM